MIGPRHRNRKEERRAFYWVFTAFGLKAADLKPNRISEYLLEPPRPVWCPETKVLCSDAFSCTGAAPIVTVAKVRLVSGRSREGFSQGSVKSVLVT